MGRVYSPAQPWGRFHTERFFCITADQDWAPEWATEFMLEWLDGLGLSAHFFQTSASESISEAHRRGSITLGWHPSFLSGSTHGTDEAGVVAHMERVLPGSTTARTHAFSENFYAMQRMRAAGITTDSNYPTAFSGHILPSVHISGIVRLPVWFEDDMWMRLDAKERTGVADLHSVLDTPGLKIVNLHPIHIALNSPDFDFYDRSRPAIYGDNGTGAGGLGYRGYGVRSLIEDLIVHIRSEGESFHSFEELSALALQHSAGRDDLRYGSSRD